jgi:hypothetical protein
MTPNIIMVEQYGDKVLELSKGHGIENETIYGVTELEKANTRFGLQSTGRSEMFTDLKQAKKYYSLLKL